MGKRIPPEIDHGTAAKFVEWANENIRSELSQKFSDLPWTCKLYGLNVRQRGGYDLTEIDERLLCSDLIHAPAQMKTYLGERYICVAHVFCRIEIYVHEEDAPGLVGQYREEVIELKK